MHKRQLALIVAATSLCLLAAVVIGSFFTHFDAVSQVAAALLSF